MLPSEIKSARSQVQGKEQLTQVLQPAGDKPKKGTHTSQSRMKVLRFEHFQFSSEHYKYIPNPDHDTNVSSSNSTPLQSPNLVDNRALK